MNAFVAQKNDSHIFLAINKQNKMNTTPPQTHNSYIMTCPKVIGSLHTRYNRGFNCKDSSLKSNDLLSLVIRVTPSLYYSFNNPPQLSSVRQQSSSSSQNTTPELQASSIPGRTSSNPSNTMPPPSTKNRSRNIYECMMDASKLKPSQRQHHAIMLLQNYHELCNTNDTTSIFVSLPRIPNIESLSKSTISSLGS